MSNRFKEAIDLQSACNPAGVALAFREQCVAFMRSESNTGTESVKNDPALRLIAYKLADLMGSAPDPLAYVRAYDACAKAVPEYTAVPA